MKKFDLIILGGGAAGFAAAMKADEFQAKTLIVNNNTVGIGGTCVNVGCLPTKHLLYIGEFIHKINEHHFKGIRSSISLDFRKVIDEKNKLVEQLRNEKYEKVFAGLSRVEFVEGDAKFGSKSHVHVNNETYTANKFIIATGSSSFILPIEGIDKIDYLTNIEALQLKELPESMIILGGRALALEFAQMFSRFGTKICLLQRSERIIPTEEPELATLLQQYLQDEGIEICTKVKLKSIR
ncbi:MAG: FAD-dependent oxidoreductase, partial [Candidatus Aminicenantales bacterium]